MGVTLKLRKWIDAQGGVSVLSRKLKVTGAAVRVWLRREGMPKATTLVKLSHMSGISLDEILAETMPKRVRGRR